MEIKVGAKRNFSESNFSRIFRLGEAELVSFLSELVSFLFCSLMFGSCYLLRCMNTSKC